MNKKEFNLIHNCCKENNFKWVSIDVCGNSVDRLICNICKREFIDAIFIEKLKEKLQQQEDRGKDLFTKLYLYESINRLARNENK